MNLATLQIYYRARPFQPFVIHMSDGRSIPVGHPEWMAMHSENGRRVVVITRDGFAHVLDTRHITSLQIATDDDGNGREDGESS